ncbi:CDF family zinc transporter ZitB [Hydrogenophilus islandicus]
MSHTAQRRLAQAVLLTFGFAAIEAVTGWMAGSLALLADAGHMVTDGLSLALALGASWLANRPANARYSYGYGRAELLAALINAAAMLAIVGAIVWEAWERFHTPQPIDGPLVIGVGFIGLAVNAYVAVILGGHHDHHDHNHDHPHDHDHDPANLNVQGALLHVLGDLVGSVAAILSGVVVVITGWTPIDPLLSLLIAALVGVASVRLLADALHRLLDGAPRSLALETLGQQLATIPHVVDIHDLHVWSLSGERLALTAHVALDTLEAWPEVLPQLEATAHAAGIEHTTFQPETTQCRLRTEATSCAPDRYVRCENPSPIDRN